MATLLKALFNNEVEVRRHRRGAFLYRDIFNRNTNDRARFITRSKKIEKEQIYERKHKHHHQSSRAENL